MPDPQKPQDDERIEELLSQLQGIFGKLSHSEEEESRQKVDLPPTEISAPQAAPEPPPLAPPPVPEPVAPAASEPPPPPVPEAPMPVWETPMTSAPEPAPAPPPIPEPVPPPPLAPVFEPVAPVQPPAPEPAPLQSIPMPDPVPAASAGQNVTPTAIFYPAGREPETKSLAQKLETLTPKFTKVAFQLRVMHTEPYDPKMDWKDRVLSSAQAHGIQALFIVVDRPLDDARRRAVTTECEMRQVYFHEVPLLSIEKKAFYTDLLLGLVFYFDSNRPKNT